VKFFPLSRHIRDPSTTAAAHTSSTSSSAAVVGSVGRLCPVRLRGSGATSEPSTKRARVLSASDAAASQLDDAAWCSFLGVGGDTRDLEKKLEVELDTNEDLRNQLARWQQASSQLFSICADTIGDAR
jgi:hypothetical protein